MRSWRRHNSSLQQLLCLAAASLCVQPSLAGPLPSSSRSGYISPPSTVPDFNPATWNQAYRLTLIGLSAGPHSSSKAVLASLRFPNTLLQGVQLPAKCSEAGFDSTSPESVPLGACFTRKSSPNSTFDLWIKLPGLALVNGNCLCYALDMFQGGYCMPGTRSSSAMNNYRQTMTCAALAEALVSDGAQSVSRQQALSGGRPSKGHYIALLARPESCIKGHCYPADFHAMRRDSSGTWSWKSPGMPATNRDLFGATVTDPEAAAVPGSYQLCGYFQVEPQQMLHVDDSHREPGPLPVNPALDKLRASVPGVQVDVAALPYNAATDAALSPTSRLAVEEDAAWERLRGSEQYEAWRVREKQALGLLPRGVPVGGRSGRLLRR